MFVGLFIYVYVSFDICDVSFGICDICTYLFWYMWQISGQKMPSNSHLCMQVCRCIPTTYMYIPTPLYIQGKRLKHTKRNLYVRKETYICERDVSTRKETCIYGGPQILICVCRCVGCGNARYKISIHIHIYQKRLMNIWKETYVIWKETCERPTDFSHMTAHSRICETFWNPTHTQLSETLHTHHNA